MFFGSILFDRGGDFLGGVDATLPFFLETFLMCQYMLLPHYLFIIVFHALSPHFSFHGALILKSVLVR